MRSGSIPFAGVVVVLAAALDPAGAPDISTVLGYDASSGRQPWRWRDIEVRGADLVVAPRGGHVYLAGEARGGGRSRLVALASRTGKLVLSAARPGRGWDRVTTSPDGASVYVAGPPRRTPTELHASAEVGGRQEPRIDRGFEGAHTFGVVKVERYFVIGPPGGGGELDLT